MRERERERERERAIDRKRRQSDAAQCRAQVSNAAMQGERVRARESEQLRQSDAEHCAARN
jgi:hypothetical protein